MAITLPFWSLAVEIERSEVMNTTNDEQSTQPMSTTLKQSETTPADSHEDSDSWLMVELTDTPAVQTYIDTLTHASKHMGEEMARRQAVKASQAQIVALDAKQSEVAGSITRPEINGTILFRTQRVFNGIAVRIRHDRIDMIRRLQNVRAIHALEAVEASCASSVPFTGAPDAWMSLTGITGENISIGILDSGIDYLHTDFGGSGDYGDYESNDPTIVEGDFFPNTKVVGGWDFVGDDYNGDNEPVEDPDPMDCMGHGTHVAGIAAGYGVTSDGETFDGPYDVSTDFDNLSIGPGVAPRAEMYALRVFGCSGKTRILIQAIEWATDPNGDGDFSDHLDVINMSLGSRYGSADTISAVATENAARAGVIVAASAGNYEDAYYITDSPASANSAISVAASRDDGLVFDTLRINQPSSMAGDIAASLASFVPDPGDPGISAAVVYAEPFHACAELTNAEDIDGAIALVDQGGCPADFKTQMVQSAGAIGMIVVNNGPWLPYPLSGDSEGITIPVISISYGDGLTIKQSEFEVNATISSAFFGPRAELADTLTFLSSRGPRVGDSRLKPDLTAPGTNIESALIGTGAESGMMTGTSMASPHVAGAMALLRQIHPDWPAEELKALVMNTADHDLVPDPDSAVTRYGPGRVGAGRIDIAAAARSEVVAYAVDPAGAVSISFGRIEVVDDLQTSHDVRIVNHRSEPVTYRVAYEAYADMPGVNISFPEGDELTVEADGSVLFPVRLHADAGQMQNTHDESAQTDPTMMGVERFWLSEEAGYVVLTATTGSEIPRLRIPLHAAARPASSMAVRQSKVELTEPEGSFDLNLEGTGIDSGESPPFIRSLLSVFELHENKPQLLVTEDPTADLDFIGVSSDYQARVSAGESLEDAVVSFGIVTHKEWSSPNQVAINIWIDRDLDGNDDFLVYNTGLSTPGWSESDSILVRLYEPAASTGSWQYYLNGFSPASIDAVPFNNKAFVFPVQVSSLGLTPGSSTFAYRVESYFRTGSDWFLASESETHRFDPVKPGLHLTGEHLAPFFWPDLHGQVIPVEYDTRAFLESHSLGILIIHHHNTVGEHIEIVGVSANNLRRIWRRVRP